MVHSLSFYSPSLLICSWYHAYTTDTNSTDTTDTNSTDTNSTDTTDTNSTDTTDTNSFIV